MTAVVEAPFDFTLPAELEARAPPEARGLARDEVRLLVSDSRTGRIVHARFRDLPAFLAPGDVLVVNVSGTLPARLRVRRTDGSEFDLHLSTRLAGDVWVVEPREAAVEGGERVSLAGGATATFIAPYAGSARLWLATLDLGDDPLTYVYAHGKPIKYKYVDGEWPIKDYETVYARAPGSAEMPSAGRPVSFAVLDGLREKGVTVGEVVLHTGVSSLEKGEAPYAESFEVPHATVEAIAEVKRRGGRVIAVGTTVVRALESAVDERGDLVASRGWTDLVITRERGVGVVDSLVTGFHEPRATHLAMLEAIAVPELIRRSYESALAEGYLWHEFGDSHLIL